MSGSPNPDPPTGRGGLVVIMREDPITSARLLAEELSADLAIGGGAATDALDGLRHAETDAPPDLAKLTETMRRAEEVRDRTRASAAARLARTLNTDLAIHPDTLRRAATELDAAGAVLDLARRGRNSSGPVLRRLRWAVAAGVVVAGALLALLGAPVAGAVVAVLGILSAVVAHQAGRRAARSLVPDRQADEAAARRRWEQLAGTGADPADIEAVIYRYDPRQQMVADLVGHHPAVRAADRAARIHRSAWVRAWCEAVGDQYLAPDASSRLSELADLVPVPTLAETTEHPVALVVAAPYADLSDEAARRLHQRLLTLPKGRRVIVVLGFDARTGRRSTLDLTDGATVDLTHATPDDRPSRPARRQLKDEPQPQVR